MISRHTYQQATLRISEAASYLGVSADTLRRWSDSGRIPCVRTPGNERRFRIEDLEAVMAPSEAS